jgi:hypothetical protein
MIIVGVQPTNKEVEKIKIKQHKNLLSRLDKERELMCIPWGALNLVAGEALGRMVSDCAKLDSGELRQVLKYIKVNWWGVTERYRGKTWE